MNFVEMTNEEWQEVYRHHDALIQMGELEMQTEEIRETPRAETTAIHAAKPIELQLHELGGALASVQH